MDQEIDEDCEIPEPCFDFIMQKNRPLRLIIRRDMRERISVITLSNIDDWILGNVECSGNSLS